jgi:nucleoid-associated protein YgaU
MLREMGARDATARAARPEQFVDLTFVKELDASGYVDRLYKSQAVAKAPARPEPAPVPPVASAPAPSTPGAKVASVEEKAKPTTAKPVIATAEKPQMPARPTSPPGSESAVSQEYVVKPGDTLSKLAGIFYNSVYKWERIYQANRDTVKNPHYIYIGQKLMIPPDDQAG